ncbi:methyl-accepting chemotaxis protein [Anaerocolumna sp. AGMB13025]|uniref:methyl-accepting chemotaxis protein n=1 Tax=Anaerocolumna sp. AGMB13025 TaxID=3039116 RepID=UPI00241D5E56|nr:methyl-accepting chemotaxis protein [Anaerocolumna sp. AGMB13025]WFR56504.1 methyl-accepting chemotaxis protein [Anaerocolumna sp. AGMB13025]
MKVNVRQKMLLIFGVLILIISAIGIYSLFELSNMDKELSDLYSMHFKGIEYIKDAQVDLISINRSRIDMIQETDLETQKQHSDTIQSLFIQFEDNMKSFDDTIVLEKSKQLAADVETLWQQLKPKEEMIIDLVLQGKNEEAYKESEGLHDLSNQIEEKINLLVENKNELGVQAYTKSNQAFVRTRNITVTIIIISVLIGLASAFIMARLLVTPILKIVHAAKMIASGDLTAEAIHVKNKDEIRDLAESFNEMTEGLRNVIFKVSTASEQVASSSEELSASAEETAASSEEVAKTINQLAEGASDQAKSSKDISDVAGQIVSNINRVSEHVNLVTDSSSRVSDEARQGVEEAKKAIEKIQSIQAVTEESSEKVRILGNKSAEIGEIISVIKEIAGQTNLLSLNAAIEAARAGEQGKGFAVVAEEIRKLAEQSANSVIEIAELVGSIQYETNQVVDIMSASTEVVMEGVTTVDKAGNSFEQIFEEIKAIAGKLSDVGTATQTIRRDSEGLNASIKNITSIAMESAASSQEISAASEEQSATVEEITRASQDLAVLAQELRMDIARFKI